MNYEVNGTAQNSAGNGPGTELPTAEKVHFDGTSLAEGSDAAIRDLIAEYRSVSQLFLEVHASEGLSVAEAAAQIAARIVSLRQGLVAGGLDENEFDVQPASPASP